MKIMYFNHIEKNNKKKIIIINYHYLLYLFAIIKLIRKTISSVLSAQQ